MRWYSVRKLTGDLEKAGYTLEETHLKANVPGGRGYSRQLRIGVCRQTLTYLRVENRELIPF